MSHLTGGSTFAETVDEFWSSSWRAGELLAQRDGCAIYVNPELAHDRRVTVLRGPAGFVTATISPAIADRLNSPFSADWTIEAALTDAGVTMHDADNLFYFERPAKAELLREPAPAHIRPLVEADAPAFAAFESSASEADRDDAYVELDHWSVFGAFEGARLVSVTSAYPWRGSRLADVGILTLEESRGRGHARQLVRAICAEIYSRGYEPQYRCQLDNVGSRAVARSAGFTAYGTWQVVSPDSKV